MNWVKIPSMKNRSKAGEGSPYYVKPVKERLKDLNTPME